MPEPVESYLPKEKKTDDQPKDRSIQTKEIPKNVHRPALMPFLGNGNIRQLRDDYIERLKEGYDYRV